MAFKELLNLAGGGVIRTDDKKSAPEELKGKKKIKCKMVLSMFIQRN